MFYYLKFLGVVLAGDVGGAVVGDVGGAVVGETGSGPRCGGGGCVSPFGVVGPVAFCGLFGIFSLGPVGCCTGLRDSIVTNCASPRLNGLIAVARKFTLPISVIVRYFVVIV
jgi:hypothetical protein